MFIVDAAEPARFDEVREELHALLMNEDVAEVPILVLGNKIDKHGAANESELKGAYCTCTAKLESTNVRKRGRILPCQDCTSSTKLLLVRIRSLRRLRLCLASKTVAH